MEELQIDVKEVCLLGWVNANTAYVLSDVPVFLVRVGRESVVDVSADAHEVIDHVAWYSLDDLFKRIADGGIRCGFTLSAVAFLMARRDEVLRFAKGELMSSVKK